MMGLIPAPEPKFKLSNFMKVLGDQAVADPSKVELKVLQQMQQRVLNHEMRNQAAKLTPQERKEKKIKKIREDTSKCVSVAVFVVKDFSNLKHRFKVDVNAQQLFLSGIGTVFFSQSLLFY
jgi:U4/U6 small nuclear ribonucleoprotein PRP3